MIERQDVDGREATVAYLDNHFDPVSKAGAKIIKLMFDDGDIYFLFRRTEDKNAQ